MKRLLLLALLTVIDGGAAEPKERPRLPPGATASPGRPASGEASAAAEGGSFKAFLQAKDRRPVGLEAAPEVVAARAEQVAEKPAAYAKPGSPGTNGVGTTDPDVLVLPKMEVTAERVTKLKAQLAELESRQALEDRIAARAAEPSWLERFLNPPFLRLGGYSSEASAALAKKRTEVLDLVKVLTLALDQAKTPEERIQIQTDIDGLNEMTRHWR
ncbi:hypothetical protein ESB00_03460 [Oleiharenicola lentus]|jgi:hypothetical protein|uniref:Uncharacterized protein n=1 Tax=Oleiharenicola lentus TaxID=2508720 RepID=A0A4V1M6D0_9BACT|nr:hypothetical protein [Oleiharenicola lentus]RXK54969.1 hypothetical protein ESB00_03460 [Oleiharenicola lentus]